MQKKTTVSARKVLIYITAFLLCASHERMTVIYIKKNTRPFIIPSRNSTKNSSLIARSAQVTPKKILPYKNASFMRLLK